MFIGAGSTILYYANEGGWTRSWHEELPQDFWGWQVVDDTVLMLGVTTLSAFEDHGTLRRTTFVELPRTYKVEADAARLDDMGTVREFSLKTGPHAYLHRPGFHRDSGVWVLTGSVGTF